LYQLTNVNMITDAFLALAAYVINLIAGVFPISTGFPTEAFTAMEYLGSFYKLLDVFFPLSTLYTAVAIAVGVELVIFAYNNLSKIVSHIPLVGGRH